MPRSVSNSSNPVPSTHWLAIAGLWGVAAAMPLLDLIGRNPEFFVAHRADRATILIFAVGVALAGPILLGLVVWLARRAWQTAGTIVLVGVVAVLAAALAVQAAKQAGVQTWTVASAIAATAGAGSAVAFARVAAVRMFAALLSFSVVLAPTIFLSRPGVRRLLAAPPGVATVAVHDGASNSSRRAAVRRAPGAPVVLIVLDEVPLLSLLDGNRQIDSVRYPHMASLARAGTWYRNATTVSDQTRWAVPAILTGSYPRGNPLPTAADHPDSVFSLLGRTHRLHAQESITRICPDSLCVPPRIPLASQLAAIASDMRVVALHLLLTDDSKAGLPSLGGDWAGFAGRETREERRRRRIERRQSHERSARADATAAFIAGMTADGRRPTFHYLHTLLAHFAHVWLPTGQRNGTVAAIPGLDPNSTMWEDDEWAVIQHYQRHLLQLGYVDRLLGDLLARLKNTGVYDRALIILTADHGAAHQAGTPRRDFTPAIAAEVMRVPLIIKYPPGVGGGAAVSDRNVQTVDILPTIADVLDLDLPWRTDGVSLLDGTHPEPPGKKLFSYQSRTTYEFGPEGPDIGPRLRRKLEIFGDGSNAYFVPRPARFADLVGMRVDAFRILDRDRRVELDYAKDFLNVNTRGARVPFEVSGRIEGSPPTQPVFVAVALNGTIRAVTLTWRKEPHRFSATPSLDHWRNGRNEVRVYVVDSDERGAVLESLGD